MAEAADVRRMGGGVAGAGPPAWFAEARATLALAWPLIAAQLAQIDRAATDTIRMG